MVRGRIETSCAHTALECTYSVFSRVARDFVTGFRKRKLARKEEAKAKAKERMRQQVLEERKEVHGGGS